MRGSFQVLAVAVVIFFGVGEFLGGWYVGVAPQTPVLVYKKTHTTTLTRRVTGDTFTFDLGGEVRGGTVTVEGLYERPASYQNPGRAALPPRELFNKRFGPGERVRVAETLKAGTGVYRVRVTFEAATGLFHLEVPAASEL